MAKFGVQRKFRKTFRKKKFHRKRTFRKKQGIRYDGMIKVKYVVTKEMLVDTGDVQGKANFDVIWGAPTLATATNKVTIADSTEAERYFDLYQFYSV